MKISEINACPGDIHHLSFLQLTEAVYESFTKFVKSFAT